MNCVICTRKTTDILERWISNVATFEKVRGKKDKKKVRKKKIREKLREKSTEEKSNGKSHVTSGDVTSGQACARYHFR